MSLAAWKYFKSPRHPRDGRRARPWDLLHPVAFRYDRYRPQTQSPLFQLPPELRALIFEYTLHEYVNYDKPRVQPKAIAASHPLYHAQLKYHVNVDTALLRTCQRVYQEAWWIPIVSAEFLLGRIVSHPIELWTSNILTIYHRRHSLRLGVKGIEIDHVRVLAPSALGGVATILSLAHFHPRCMTLTVKAIDIACARWTLNIPSSFISKTKVLLPASVREIRFELETNECNREDLILLSNLIRATWALDRVDGVRLVASPTQHVPIYRWTPCVKDIAPQQAKENITPYIGMVTSLYPINKVDLRSALPLELPVLHSRGIPLTYGTPARCSVVSWGPCPTVEYALSLAEHPLVSRDWKPPPPLPDLPIVTHCASCEFAHVRTSTPVTAVTPATPVTLVTHEAPAPAPSVPSADPSQPAGGGLSTHAISTAATRPPNEGSCGRGIFYGTIVTQDLPGPIPAVQSHPKQFKLAWWHWVCIMLICMGFIVLAWRQVR